MYPLSLIVLFFNLATLAISQTLDPSTVPDPTREYWCQQQIEACPLLCRQLPGTSELPKSNDCDSSTLQFHCICSNNMSPNASEYSQTIPYFICTENNNACVKNCPATDSFCQSQCREKNPCGAQHPKPANKTTATATVPPSTTTSRPPTDAVYTGLGEGSAATGKPKTGDSFRITMAGGYLGLAVFISALLYGCPALP